MKKLGFIFCLYLPLVIYSQSRIETLRNYLTALHNDNGMNGNIAVIENGNLIYKNSFGDADFSSQKPNTDSSLFPLASISKTFTGMAVLKLCEQKKLSLSDSVQQFFPAFQIGRAHV